MTHHRGRGARVGRIVFVLLAACLGAPAVLAEDARIKGRFFQVMTDEHGTGQTEVTFECTGAPTCTGRYQVASRASGCSNTVHRSGAMSLTNVDLSRPTFSGTMFAEKAFFHDRFEADGTCSVRPNTDRDLLHPYTATMASSSGGAIVLVDLLVDDIQLNRATLNGTFTVGNVASPAAATRVTGSAAAQSGAAAIEFTFSCGGEPACTGTYRLRATEPGCDLTLGSDIIVTGLDLSRPGPLAGQFVFRNWDWTPVVGCQPGPTAVFFDMTFAYTGSWDGDRGTFAFEYGETNSHFRFNGTFSAERQAPQPPFEMAVASNINATTATATAQVSFRAEDVGKPASVFVFAYAPAARVSGGAAQAKDDTGCVLAQLDASGRLVARASASQLQSFFTGVLASQGAAVAIMNNVPTPAVAGTTFYVGYGADADAMLNEGVFRDAVLVPGAGVCPLLPMQTALWWNPRESGWGLNLNHQGNVLFGTLFTYDAQRAPMWLVMSAGLMRPDGRSFTGELYRTTGPAFDAAPFTPITAANLTQVGTMSVAFVDANVATLTYTVDGAQVTKSIQRQVFGARPANCMPLTGSRATSTNYQDLWWNAAESGWGINIAHQGDILFATLFTYNAAGRGLWLVMSAGRRQADGSYSGELYRTAGPAFNAAPFTPIGASDLTQVGTMRLRFADGERGELTYTFDGVTVAKQITRQVFASPAFACN